MKFCPHCHRWNPGQPQRCRYCARTWGVRVCSAGHINPADARFCGECGRPGLSDPAGQEPMLLRFLRKTKFVAVVVLMFLVAI